MTLLFWIALGAFVWALCYQKKERVWMPGEKKTQVDKQVIVFLGILVVCLFLGMTSDDKKKEKTTETKPATQEQPFKLNWEVPVKK